MKPKHPKRLSFRPVKRAAPRPRRQPLVLQLHRGNAPASDSSGCLLLPEVQVKLIDKSGTVLQEFSASLVRMATGMHRVATALAPVLSYQAQLQLLPAEAAWLRTLAG